MLQLNRDNVRFLELNGRLDQDVRKARADAEGQQQELDALRLTAAEHAALRVRWTQDVHQLEALQAELQHASNTLAQERGLRQQAEAEALTLRVRLEATEAVFARLRPVTDAGAATPGAQDEERP